MACCYQRKKKRCDRIRKRELHGGGERTRKGGLRRKGGEVASGKGTSKKGGKNPTKTPRNMMGEILGERPSVS